MRFALKWGALTGLGAYVVGRLILTLGAMLLFGDGPSDLDHPGILTSACLGIFIILFAFSAAGYYAGRDTLKAGMGAVAGMVAMAVYAALSAIYTPGAAAATPSQPGQPAVSPIAQAISLVAAALVVFGIAALMGWLGGRPGAANARKRALKAQQAAAEAAATSAEKVGQQAGE